MKRLLAVLLLFSATLLFAQQAQKRIFVSPKSNITTAEIADGFSKYCPNVVLTQNETKADYVLEAAETMSADEGTTYRHWHYAHESGRRRAHDNSSRTSLYEAS